MEETPQSIGFALEALIGEGIKALTGLTHKNEQEIRSLFNDASMNGVDHWISYSDLSGMSQHVLAQTKWRETSSQPEVSQFLSCVDRICARLPSDEQRSVYLVWICKHSPSRHALRLLEERRVSIVCCDVSPEMLARNAVGWVAETFGLDPTPGLLRIPIRRARRVVADLPSSVPAVRCSASASASAAAAAATATAALLYDETEAGRAARAALEGLLVRIQGDITRRLFAALRGASDLLILLESVFPTNLDVWGSCRFTKVNFNAFLRSLKPLCVPTRSRRGVTSSQYFIYVKMRALSIDLSRYANEYNTKRSTMVVERSLWARRLPTLVCSPEHMAESEYLSTIVFCDDYTLHVEREGCGSSTSMTTRTPFDTMFSTLYRV
jgi:hypothetical protein